MPDNEQPPIPDDADMPPDPFGAGDPFEVSASDDNGTTSPTDEPFANGADPFAALGSMFGPMMGDLAKAMSAQTQNGWQQAKHYAVIRASGESGTTQPSSPDRPVDPLERIRLEELVGIVERHVVDFTGQELSGPKGLTVLAHTRAGWASAFLDAHRRALEPALGLPSPPPVDSGGSPGSPEAIMSGLIAAVGPSMMAMQIGAMAGQLSHRYFGSGDLPLPRANADSVSFIPSNISRFADEWSLPIDSLRVRVAIDELVSHGIVRLPHIASSLRTNIARHASAFTIDADALMERFAALGTDPAALQDQLAEITSTAARSATPDQRQAAAALQRLNSIISGYVGHVGDRVGTQLLGGDRRVAEAMRRRRLQPDEATDMLASLTGLQITAEQHDRGAAFIDGVLERTGDLGAVPLQTLWTSEANLPTESELDAPGLWLARIELQQP